MLHVYKRRQPVLDAFRLSHERRGQVAYVSWLEARAAREGGMIGEAAMAAIRGGWYLGEEGFKAKLLGLIDKAGAKMRKRGNVAGAAIRETASHRASCLNEPACEPNSERSTQDEILA